MSAVMSAGGEGGKKEKKKKDKFCQTRCPPLCPPRPLEFRGSDLVGRVHGRARVCCHPSHTPDSRGAPVTRQKELLFRCSIVPRTYPRLCSAPPPLYTSCRARRSRSVAARRRRRAPLEGASKSEEKARSNVPLAPPQIREE